MHIKSQNYTWKDKEYYKLYQRELCAKHVGQTCVCEICGKVASVNNLRKHIKTKQCKAAGEKLKDRLERAERIETLFKGLINDLSAFTDFEKLD